jgi:osmoprotectant transport system substrate-binding protein
MDFSGRRYSLSPNSGRVAAGQQETIMLSKLLAAAAALALTAGVANAQVVVSSKIDTEGGLLGNVISQVLQAGGVPVTEKIQLGGTPVVREAITAGQIDIYPEYTGNAAFFFNKADDPLWNDAAAAYAEAKKLDYDANKIVWLQPAPANNTWAVALRKDLADANSLVTFSDFGAYVAGGGAVKLAASAEFVSSPAALPKFQEVYGFTLSADQLVTLSGGDTAATIAAAAQQTNGVNAAMVYGTDGGIAPSGLVVLTDDKGVQPVYEPAPIIREAVLQQYPQIETLLAPVFAKLDLATLQELNGRIQVGGEAASAVAAEWLKANGFVQ